jgi:hypothetical protein
MTTDEARPVPNASTLISREKRWDERSAIRVSGTRRTPQIPRLGFPSSIGKSRLRRFCDQL